MNRVIKKQLVPKKLLEKVRAKYNTREEKSFSFLNLRNDLWVYIAKNKALIGVTLYDKYKRKTNYPSLTTITYAFKEVPGDDYGATPDITNLLCFYATDKSFAQFNKLEKRKVPKVSVSKRNVSRKNRHEEFSSKIPSQIKLLLDEENYIMAIPLLVKKIKTQQSIVNNERANLMSDIFYLAFCMFKLRKYSEAAQYCNVLFDNGIHFSLAYQLQALSYYKLRHISKALESAQKVTELEPRYANGFMLCGLLCFLENKMDKAEKMFVECNILVISKKAVWLEDLLNREHVKRLEILNDKNFSKDFVGLGGLYNMILVYLRRGKIITADEIITQQLGLMPKHSFLKALKAFIKPFVEVYNQGALFDDKPMYNENLPNNFRAEFQKQNYRIWTSYAHSLLQYRDEQNDLLANKILEYCKNLRAISVHDYAPLIESPFKYLAIALVKEESL